MNILSLSIAILGLSSNNVLLINQTGLKMIRIEIAGRRWEEVNNKVDEILISVTPEKHDMIVYFKGGAHIDWPAFNFKGIHQIFFYKVGYEIKAHPE